MKYKAVTTPYLAFAPDINQMLPYVVVEDEFPFMAVFYTAHKEVAEELAKRLNDTPIAKLDLVAAIKNVLSDKGVGTSLDDLQKLAAKSKP